MDVHFDTNSLSTWLSYYYSVHVKGAPQKTESAKKSDLSKFIHEVGHDLLDNWSPPVRKKPEIHVKHFLKKRQT